MSGDRNDGRRVYFTPRLDGLAMGEDPPRNIAGLKDASLTVNGYFDDGAAAWVNQLSHSPVSVRYSLPANRWQAFKQAYAQRWWMAWVVRLRPIRYIDKLNFMGETQLNEDGSITVRSLDTPVT